MNGTIPQFLKAKNMPYSLITMRKFILDNLDLFRDVVVVKENKERKSIRILDFDKFEDLLKKQDK